MSDTDSWDFREDLLDYLHYDPKRLLEDKKAALRYECNLNGHHEASPDANGNLSPETTLQKDEVKGRMDQGSEDDPEANPEATSEDDPEDDPKGDSEDDSEDDSETDSLVSRSDYSENEEGNDSQAKRGSWSLSLRIGGNFSQSRSRMSVSGATIFDKLESDNPNSFLTIYFCGHDTATDTPVTSSNRRIVNMMKSLIAQLLDLIIENQIAVDLTNIYDEIRTARHFGFTQFLGLFERLVKELPTDSVLYCILDHMPNVEYVHRRGKRISVLQSLTALVDSIGKEVTMRLLLTTPGGRVVLG